MWSTLNLIFNLFSILLLLSFLRFKVVDYLRETNKKLFWTFRRHKYILTVVGLFALAMASIQILPDVSALEDEVQRLHFNTVLGIAASLAITLIWAVYIRKLDIYEPEHWGHIFIVFLLGCVTVWLAFPMTTFLWTVVGFRLNGEALNDFLYCTIGIGMVEEFVKMIPLMIIIRFRRIVNEPYDFILYASMAALGFAFIENSMYIQRTDFYAINGRALMSTVAHMTFSSVIGYSFMVASCRRAGRGWYYILGGFLLASTMHGFYDFWLINALVRKYDGLSFLFFILTTHFWFTLKNKAINASYFFDESVVLVNDHLRFFLIKWLVVLLMGSAVLIGVFHGSDTAIRFLKNQVYAYGFLIYYLSFSFSRFVLAPRALAACEVAFAKVIPEEPDPQDWQSFYEQKHW